MQIIGIDPETADVPLRAVRVLLAGGVVAFPTDTYYALGAVVWNSEAVARIVAAKRRPARDPLSALVADRDQWRAVAASLPDGALRLADRFWPGALTIVCRAAPHLPPALTGGGGTIGARQPRSAAAMALCRAVGAPLTGTSANTHGRPAPITAVEVALDLGSAVDLILDGGRCPVAQPSTVVDLTETPFRIVRAGVVSADAIREALDAVAAG
ncbi:MAG TPA: L-threonylcarbamoyladenylate synthase [bacterium]|nr:L-threonylcarbamoyladenylate synthase [bacterium]